MIKTRIASAAAIFAFGLAAVGGTVLTVAAPANAAPSASGTSSSSGNGSWQPNQAPPEEAQRVGDAARTGQLRPNWDGPTNGR
jgi:hypothetical protein